MKTMNIEHRALFSMKRETKTNVSNATKMAKFDDMHT